MSRIQLWSSGGGTQSNAIAVLILQGKLPKPDLTVIADTEREKDATWSYMERFTAPALLEIGVTIHRIKKSHLGAPDVYAKGSEDVLMPMFTTESGTVGKLPTYCSTEWKQRPVRRFASSRFPDAKFDVWMGMTIDEPKRIKPTIGKWQTRYPLVELRMTKTAAIKLVMDYGWPEPPGSSCWMCPNRSPEQWRKLAESSPGEVMKAVILEEELREKDDDLYFHQYGVPLAAALLMTPPKEPTLFDTERCDSGLCFT